MSVQIPKYQNQQKRSEGSKKYCSAQIQSSSKQKAFARRSL